MEVDLLIAMMSALAQPTRLRVIEILGREFPNGLPVGEIAARAETPQNTMSTHLAILTRAKLVTSNRDGRIVRYSVNPDALDRLAEQIQSRMPARSGSADVATLPTDRTLGGRP